MKNFALLLGACLAFSGLQAAQATGKTAAQPAKSSGPKHLGELIVDVDSRKLSVSITSGSPELATLAQTAFRSHGRYKVVSGQAQFAIKFTPVGGNQVRVDVTRGGGASVLSQVASGSSLHNALLKAADIAVEATNGLGLKGFFASKLTFINEQGGKREVYVGNLFFSNGEVRQITNDKASALSPRWSHDGRKILYTSFYKSGFPDVFAIDTGSYQRSTFASFRGTNSGARFSPTGAQVAMILSGPGNPELFVAGANGLNPKRLTTTKDAVEASPCFSPDGGRIVYTSDAAGGPQLYVLPAAGGAPTRLSTGYAYSAEPDWSRTKPNLIAFTARSGGYQIAVYDMTKGRATVVSKAPFDGVEPSWLADGRHIVYTARDRSTSVLCILDSETGQSVRISPASWSTCQASVLAP